MISSYDGVKYYDFYDSAYSYFLGKAVEVLKLFKQDRDLDINNIIELFNITRYFDNKNLRLESWTDDNYNNYVKQSNSLKPIIGKFVNTFNDSNFIFRYEQLDVNYLDDFWSLLSAYQNKKTISDEIITTLLNKHSRCICDLLKHKKLVDLYKASIKSFMLNNSFSAEILVEKYALKDGVDYNIPNNISKEDKEKIIRHYIASSDTNINYLQALATAPSSKEFEINDLLRRDISLALKREEVKFLKTAKINELNISISFTDIEDICKRKCSAHKVDIQYNRRWFESHLDYLQILFVFKYCFGFFSGEFNSSFVSHRDQISLFEQISNFKGKKDYPASIHFETMNKIFSMTLHGYYDLLLSHGIELQDVFEWFFKYYVPRNLGVEGFEFNASSIKSTIAEKNKNVSSEMERILNQYYCYVKEGRIDKELLSIFSQQVKYSDYPSLLSNKYCYLKSNQIQWFAHWLYSTKSGIISRIKTKNKYDTLYKFVNNEKITVNDFYEHHQENIKSLIDNGYLFVDDKNILKANHNKCSILYYAHVYGSFRRYYHPELEEYIKDLEDNDEIYYENTLFPHNEAEYINYILNNAEFNNGPSIRNKYSHGTYSGDVNQQMLDYMELLKVMLMVIMRINEELIIAADIRDNEGSIGKKIVN